jgi:Lysylphosphatidylglycerol synthase TM region
MSAAIRRALPIALTVALLALIGRRIPMGRLVSALQDANYPAFLAVMIPNTVIYFCWDTLILRTVLRWFHGDVPYRDLLPVRAASYVVGFFNTNAGRGALAAYLWRRLDAPFLELSGTVMFLVLTEYTQLVLWAMLGVFGFRTDVTAGLLAIAAGVAACWLIFFGYTRLRITPVRALHWLFAPREWLVLRTFRRATAVRYAQVVLLRAPMFLVSLGAHYYGAHAFGIDIPFAQMLTFLPVIFMVAALPVTVAHLGTTQAAWLLFFGRFASAPRLLAFSLVAHLTFAATRALLGLAWLPVAYTELAPALSRLPRPLGPRPTDLHAQ